MNKQLKLFPPTSPYYDLIKDLLAACEAAETTTVSLGSVRDRAKSAEARVRHERLLLDDDTTTTFRKIAVDNLLDVLDRLDDGHMIREYASSAKAEDEIEHLTDLDVRARILRALGV